MTFDPGAYICGCGYPMIVTDDAVCMHERGKWIVYNKDLQDFDILRPHPDPDRFYAEFTAAQLLGEIST